MNAVEDGEDESDDEFFDAQESVSDDLIKQLQDIGIEDE